MSTPSLRDETMLDAISRAARRSNRERHTALGVSGTAVDNILLLSERRSLSPIMKRHADTRTTVPSRLSQLGSHTFYHREQSVDGDAAEDGGKKKKKYTRRTSLPENIKPMQNDNESTIMEAGAMRYLPKILRDIYAQRQTRRPSAVRISIDY